MGNKETVIALFDRLNSSLDILRNSAPEGTELPNNIHTMKHLLYCLKCDIPRDEKGMLHSELIQNFYHSLTSKQRDGLLSCVDTLQPKDRSEEEGLLRDLQRELGKFNLLNELGIVNLTMNLLDTTYLIRHISDGV